MNCGCAPIVVGLLLVIPAGASARERGRDALETLTLEDLLEVEVVTPAVRTRIAGDVPGTVHVVTEEVIRRRGYRDLSELLDDIPEVQIQRSASSDRGNLVTMRGIMGNAKFLILVDGVRAGTLDGTPMSVGANYPLANVRRVEVVLGPVSAVYGPDAFSGVVQMLTRDGGRVRGIEAAGSYGTFQTTRDSVVAGVHLGEVSAALTVAGSSTQGAYLPAFYPDEFSWYTEHYLPDGEMLRSPFSAEGTVVDVREWGNASAARFVHARIDAGPLTLGFLTHREEHVSATGKRPEYAIYTNDASWASAVSTAWIGHDRLLALDRVRWVTRVSGSTFRVDPDSSFLNSSSGYEVAWKYASTLGGRAESSLSWTTTRWLALSGGLVGEQSRVMPKSGDLSSPYDPTLPSEVQGYVYPGSDVLSADGASLAEDQVFYTLECRSLGAFVEADGRIGDQLSATVGVRYDGSSWWHSTVNPRAGLVLRPFPETRLRFSYGEAFLAPSGYEAWQQYGSFQAQLGEDREVLGLESAFFHVPNPDLRGEKLRTTEFGASQAFGSFGVAGASMYVTRIQDPITVETSAHGEVAGWPVDVVERATNAGEARIAGGALWASASVHPGAFDVSPHVAWSTVAGDVAGDPVPYAARHKVGVGVDLGWEAFSVSGRWNWRSATLHPRAARGTDPGDVAPAGGRVDAFARWSPGSPGQRVQGALTVEARNLLDARLWNVGDDRADAFAAVPQSPRTVLVGLELGL